MKWFITLIIISILGIGGYFLAAHLSGGALPTLGLDLGGDRQALRQASLKFWEDMKFKDLQSASKLLPPEKQDMSGVSSFLTHIFQSNVTTLDIASYDIESVELDSTGLRARVKADVVAKDLARGVPLKAAVVLFFHKVKDKWYLDLDKSF